MKKQFHYLFIAFFIISNAHFSLGQYKIPKESNSKYGMVVSAHPEATRIGAEILAKGGNAVDAAIAVQFALAVVYPNAGNIGGGGFMVWQNGSGKALTLDFREMAPSKAHKDMYLEKDGSVSKTKSIHGSLAAGVPGVVKGMEDAHKMLGKLPWKDLIKPSYNLAKKGFLLTERQAGLLNYSFKKFSEINNKPTAFNSKSDWKIGDILIQTELSSTLNQIMKKGSKGFYSGTIAKHIVNHMKNTGGIISLEDLANYKAKWRTPLVTTYKDYTITTMPPPSSGGVALTQLLKMVEASRLGDKEYHSIDRFHLIAEAEKRVYADRAKYLGDPDFFNIPVKGLTDSLYCAQRIADYNPLKVTPQNQISSGKPSGYESMETTHFSIVDKDGTMVSVTTTLNGNFGSMSVVENAGFILNNEMDDFSSKPGTPNMFGLIGSKANQIDSGKRMLSSMTPTIISKNGVPIYAIGSPGGGTIITTVFQVVMNLLEYKMNLSDAVNSTRFHHQWTPDLFFYEKNGEDEELLPLLVQMGYIIDRPQFLGCVGAVKRNIDNTFTGVGDKRGDDCASGPNGQK